MSKMNNNKNVSRNKMLISCYIWKICFRQFQNKDYGDIVPKNARHLFMLSSDKYLKIAPGMDQYCGLRVDYLNKNKFPPRCKVQIHELSCFDH